MNAIIRAYTNDDSDSCLAAFKSNVPFYFTEEEIADFENFLQRIGSSDPKDHIHRTHFFVIVWEGKIVGCGGFGDKDNTLDKITLAWGHIHKDYHRKGFGEQLLSFRLKQIKRLYPDLPLLIDTTQFSYPFYEKYGFQTLSITNDFYAVGMHRYDMVFRKM